MTSIHFFPSIFSLFFILGIHSLGKRLTEILKLNKLNHFIIFNNLILLICLIFYLLNIIKFSKNELVSKIFFYSIAIYGLGYLYSKIKKVKFEKIYIYKNILFYLTLFSILIASIVPVTDADSIRYHLGQYAVTEIQSNLFNLHSKISFIGDGINAISYYTKTFNITSLINCYSLYILFRNLSKSVQNSRSLILIILSSPILINLIISQKPFFWIIINLFYIICFHKKIINENLGLNLIILNLSLSFISKPEFIIIVPVLTFYLLRFKDFTRFFNYKNVIIILLLFSTILFFFIANYLYFGNFFKILLFQNNDLEKNFLSFLKGSNVEINIKNIFYFLLNLGIPNNFQSNFTNILGIGFLVSLFHLNFKENKKLIFLVLILLTINILTNRISIEENHGRNYFLIFLILIFLNSKRDILKSKFIKVVLIIQLIISQLTFLYFNYAIYVKKNYNNIAYQYNNEKFVNNYVKNMDATVISELDGNLFKNYNFVNADTLNFDKNYLSYISEMIDANENKKIILILKKSNKLDRIKDFKIKEINLKINSRNPFNNETIQYDVFRIELEKLKQLY